MLITLTKSYRPVTAVIFVISLCWIGQILNGKTDDTAFFNMMFSFFVLMNLLISGLQSKKDLSLTKKTSFQAMRDGAAFRAVMILLCISSAVGFVLRDLRLPILFSYWQIILLLIITAETLRLCFHIYYLTHTEA